LLAATSWLAPRTWQQKGTQGRFKARGPILRWLSPSRAPTLRSEDPVAWVISRDRWSANIARLAVALILALFAVSMAQGWKTAPKPSVSPGLRTIPGGGATNSAGAMTYSYNSGSHSTWYVVVNASVRTPTFRAASACVSILSWLLELWLAVQVSRFYIEGKKSGFLELLLVTPTTPAEVVRSHWRALRQIFLLPVTAQLLAMLGIGALGSM